MRTLFYKDFSLKFHRMNWQKKKPNICRFELTFGCGLHCRHCYSDCYNKTRYIQRELLTKEVKFILDKLYSRGMLWLCFTGGDPLTRRDFLDLYTYAKGKGFIITIFTNAYSMDQRIARHLKDWPPFVIEITLNAVSEDLCEKITQVKGSFVKIMQGIDLILKAGLPLKIKTQVTKDNLGQLPKIKQYIEKLGSNFYPVTLLHNRLNGDSAPANLRIFPQEVLRLGGNKKSLLDNCDLLPRADKREPITEIFRCALAGGDGIHVDPYGNIIPCNCIRKPRVSLLKQDLEIARVQILDWIKTRHFTNNSECHKCSIRNICFNCPGTALLETQDLEGKIDWFCDLAHIKYAKKTNS